MSSILDHVEQAVPRATVYGAMKGSPVFIGKYFREINPASNATQYDYTSGERRINIVVASPDKTIFNDLRSAYLRFDLSLPESNDKHFKITEPASNFIERIVIKMNGTVVEDISRFDRLTSFFKRKLLTRSQKNARTREGWDYVGAPQGTVQDIDGATSAIEATFANSNNTAADATANGLINAAINDEIDDAVEALVDAINLALKPSHGEHETGTKGNDSGYTVARGAEDGSKDICIKLDLSGIFNCQQLLSGYYSPLEIDLYLQDPAVCLSKANANNDHDDYIPNYIIQKPRLCMEQIVMSPEYVSAFEAALLANSSAQGIQIPFTTYYTYQQRIKDQTTFWVRKPVRYLKGVYWGATQASKSNASQYDSYGFSRVTSNGASTSAGRGTAALSDGTSAHATCISKWRVSIGTKTYREIDDARGYDSLTEFKAKPSCNESDVMFAKAVGHYNDYTTEDDSLAPIQRVLNNQVQGIDLEFSPDNDVLASETTLNSNDVRLELWAKQGNADDGNQYDIWTFLQYQASIALFPGNETRLLVT